MKALLSLPVIALAAALLATPANATGCLKGAVVGGVAGHYIGHHGWLGAAAGCLIGRHRAHTRARRDMYEHGGYGSSTPTTINGVSRY